MITWHIDHSLLIFRLIHGIISLFITVNVRKRSDFLYGINEFDITSIRSFVSLIEKKNLMKNYYSVFYTRIIF